MFPFLTPYLPSQLTKYPDFTDWLSDPYRMEGFAEMLAYTLPGDRSSFYQTSSMAKMRRNVFDELEDVTKALGVYPVVS